MAAIRLAVVECGKKFIWGGGGRLLSDEVTAIGGGEHPLFIAAISSLRSTGDWLPLLLFPVGLVAAAAVRSSGNDSLGKRRSCGSKENGGCDPGLLFGVRLAPLLAAIAAK